MQNEGAIVFRAPADIVGPEVGLAGDGAPQVDRFPALWMLQRGVELFLDTLDEDASADRQQAARAILVTRLEILGLDAPVEQELEDDGVDDERAKLFHKIGSQTRMPVGQGMQGADVGMQAAPHEQCEDILEEDGVAVGEQDIDRVTRGGAGCAG